MPHQPILACSCEGAITTSECFHQCVHAVHVSFHCLLGFRSVAAAILSAGKRSLIRVCMYCYHMSSEFGFERCCKRAKFTLERLLASVLSIHVCVQ